MQLNPEQQLASTTLNGPLVIFAGAGTGKTRVITIRTKNIIDSGVTPNKILCITFTNKASHEMTERINNKNVNIMTYHKLGLRIISSNPEFLKRTKRFTLIDSSYKYIKRILLDLKILTKSELKSKLDDYVEKVNSNYKSKEINQIRDIYEYYKIKDDVFDLNDLLTESLKLLLEDKITKEKWLNKFDYIMCDEHQDVNETQHNIIYELIKHTNNICVVG